jgi:hypothetical protein
MFIHRADNRFNNSLGIAQHFVVPKSQHEISHRFQNFCPVVIVVTPFDVLSSIDFYDDASVAACKVNDVFIDPNLPLELPTAKPPVSKPKPDRAFRIGLVATQPPRCRYLVRHGAPSPHPSPLRGEGAHRILNYHAASCTAGRRPSKWQIA